MQNYLTGVIYDGKRYNTIGNDMLQGIIKNPKYILVDKCTEISREVCSIAKYIKANEILTLKLGTLYFNVEDSEFESFQEVWKDEIYFNTTTLEGFADLEACKKYSNTAFDDLCMIDFAQYLTDVTRRNASVFEYLEKNITTMFGNRNYYASFSKTFLINLVRLSTTNLLEIEKMITSGNQKLLTLLLNREDGKLEKGKKLNQVVDLPKFAIEYIKENNMEESEEYIRLISEEFDGNTLKIIFNMFNAFDNYKKNDRVKRYSTPLSTKRKTFLKGIYALLKKDYKITSLLNYILKQRMYWSKDDAFDMPFEELKLLIDFIDICEKHSLKYEKYPQDLAKMHDIVLKNISVLEDDEMNEKFVKTVSKYHSKDIEVDDFVFIAPKDICDLVKEGNDLHHCIGNYVDNVVNNLSEIYFMRFKNNLEQSFVTIELNPTLKQVVEFKEDYNKEPTNPDVLKAIKKFEKIKKK